MFIRNKILKPLAGSLAFLILLASLNITVDMHFCQGSLKSFNLFGKAKNCHELAKEMASCPHHHSNTGDGEICDEEIKDCCSNKTVQIESQIDDQLVDFKFLDDDSDTDISFSKYSANFEYFTLESELILYEHYKPPLIQKDIPILFETFLL